MYKQTITYEDFNGNTQTSTLYFNITKTELVDHLHLGEKMQEIQSMLEGDVREVTLPELTKILALVKEIVRLSYGERSADGQRFSKSDDIWMAFKDTAAYDAFLFSLFENPEKAAQFMLAVMPNDLIQQAQRATVETVPLAEPEITETTLSQAELESMSREQLLAHLQNRA
jgi:hypothetical protein